MKKYTLLMLLSIAATGCGISNKSFNVKQNDVLAARVQFDAPLSGRVSLAGGVTAYTVEDSQQLAQGYDLGADVANYRDVVRVKDTFFQAPETIKHSIDLMRSSLDVKIYPINNDVAKLYVGGGLRWLKFDMSVSSPRTGATDSSHSFGIGPTVGVYFPIQKNFAGSIDLSTFVSRESTTVSHSFTAALHWLPSPHVQLDLGLINDSYDIEDEINANWQYLSYRDCSAELNSEDYYGCPSEGDGYSDINIDATGFFTGLTFHF